MAKKKSTRSMSKARATGAKKKAPRAKKSATTKRSIKAASDYKALLKRNTKIVVIFYNLMINKKDFDAGEKYIGADYVQHNPTAATGIEGLREWMAEFHKTYPDLYAITHRTIAQDDLVVLHNESINGPGGHRAIVDIFRVRNGKVVEHWDVIQSIPASALNSNSMF
jgi:predicted SnoaL-like aldol condensation-catalyzing enzyme